jgi:hypothetical protein
MLWKALQDALLGAGEVQQPRSPPTPTGGCDEPNLSDAAAGWMTSLRDGCGWVGGGTHNTALSEVLESDPPRSRSDGADAQAARGVVGPRLAVERRGRRGGMVGSRQIFPPQSTNEISQCSTTSVPSSRSGSPAGGGSRSIGHGSAIFNAASASYVQLGQVPRSPSPVPTRRRASSPAAPTRRPQSPADESPRPPACASPAGELRIWKAERGGRTASPAATRRRRSSSSPSRAERRPSSRDTSPKHQPPPGSPATAYVYGKKQRSQSREACSVLATALGIQADARKAAAMWAEAAVAFKSALTSKGLKLGACVYAAS